MNQEPDPCATSVGRRLQLEEACGAGCRGFAETTSIWYSLDGASAQQDQDLPCWLISLSRKKARGGGLVVLLCQAVHGAQQRAN